MQSLGPNSPSVGRASHDNAGSPGILTPSGPAAEGSRNKHSSCARLRSPALCAESSSAADLRARFVANTAVSRGFRFPSDQLATSSTSTSSQPTAAAGWIPEESAGIRDDRRGLSGRLRKGSEHAWMAVRAEDDDRLPCWADEIERGNVRPRIAGRYDDASDRHQRARWWQR